VSFTSLSGSAETDAANSLTQAVVIELAQSRDIVVIDANGQTNGNDFLATHARYALVGSASVDQDRLRVRARLFDTQTSSVLWGQAFDESLGQSGLMDAEQATARSIAAALAQPYGVIFRAETSRRAQLPARDGETYTCLLAYYRYRVDLNPQAIEGVRSCLTSATERHPDDATAWALTAQLTIDSVRFPKPGAVINRQAALADAATEAGRAVSLDPQNVRALQAKMLVAFFQGQMDEALEIGRRAIAIDDNDLELAGEYGFRLALSGEWSRGCALVASAKERLTGPAGYQASVLALCAYMSGSNAEALGWIRQAALLDNPQYHLIATLVYAQAGMLDDAKREADWLTANATQFAANITEEVRLRLRRPEDREKVMASLAMAGLGGR
jgi:TolB-like protein